MTESATADRANRAASLKTRDKPAFQLAGYAGTGKTTRPNTSPRPSTVRHFAAYTGKAAHVLTKSGATNGTHSQAHLHAQGQVAAAPEGTPSGAGAALHFTSPSRKPSRRSIAAIKAEQIDLARPTFQLNAESPLVRGHARKSPQPTAGGGPGFGTDPHQAIPDSSRRAAPFLQEQARHPHGDSPPGPGQPDRSGPPRRSARAAPPPRRLRTSHKFPPPPQREELRDMVPPPPRAPDPAGRHENHEQRTYPGTPRADRRPPRKATSGTSATTTGRPQRPAGRSAATRSSTAATVKDIEGEDGAKVEVSAHPHYFHGNKRILGAEDAEEFDGQPLTVHKSQGSRRNNVRQARTGVREGPEGKGHTPPLPGPRNTSTSFTSLPKNRSNNTIESPQPFRRLTTGPQVPYSQELHAQKYRGSGESFREAIEPDRRGPEGTMTSTSRTSGTPSRRSFLPAGRIQSANGLHSPGHAIQPTSPGRSTTAWDGEGSVKRSGPRKPRPRDTGEGRRGSA